MSVRHVTGALCIKEKHGYADKEVVDREAKRSYHELYLVIRRLR